jgi:hypothetical protein
VNRNELVVFDTVVVHYIRKFKISIINQSIITLTSLSVVNRSRSCPFVNSIIIIIHFLAQIMGCTVNWFVIYAHPEMYMGKKKETLINTAPLFLVAFQFYSKYNSNQLVAIIDDFYGHALRSDLLLNYFGVDSIVLHVKDKIRSRTVISRSDNKILTIWFILFHFVAIHQKVLTTST